MAIGAAAALWIAAGGFSAAGGEDTAQRPALGLDGEWFFQLDPEGIGEDERWFRPDAAYAAPIQVPGAWDAQGFGSETEQLQHNFVGKGWYARDIEVPEDWRGRRAFLCFGGVYREATVWVNGKPAGHHLGYVSDFEFDITSLVTPGESAHIVVRVDSEQRWQEDALQGCMDIIDHLFTYWGGIWGHVSMEARSAAWLDDPFVESRIVPDTACIVSARAGGDSALAASVSVTVFGSDGREAAPQAASAVANGSVRVDVPIPEARLWTPDAPYLYTAQITLLDADGRVLDQLRQRFGLRTIELRGTDFHVNGAKYYLTGYGDDCVYPDTIAPPPDKQFYVDRLRVAKSYGFNYVRHHSHFVAPEYYEACDEVGMFVSPELPIGYPRFYDRAQGAALDLYKSEWTAAIKRYRNHPSIFDWCMANELWEGMPRVGPDLYRIAKELDPARPVIDSDGLFTAGFADGTKDRPTLDFLPVMFDILTTPLDNPGKFVTGVPLKPMITHEEGNYVHFPRLDEIDRFSQFKPFWLTDCRDRLERAGLLNEAPAWAQVSERLYLLCHKVNIESLRKNPHISGYHWWLLQPWYVGSNGLLDVHRRPIAVTPEEVRRFNAPVVLLQEGLRQTYRAGQSLEFDVLLSNYSGGPLDDGAVRVVVSSEERAFEECVLPVSAFENGKVEPVGSVRVVLPETDEPIQIRIEAALASKSVGQANDWTAWVFPSAPPQPDSGVPIHAAPDLMGLLEPFGVRPIPEGVFPAEPWVYVARQPTAALIDAAERGSCVLLLSPAGMLPTDCTTYKPAWWLGVFEGDSNAGTYVYDNPVTQGLTPSGWCGASWFHLLQGAQTFLLDDLPVRPEVLIRALNTHGAPHPFSRYVDFEYTWRDKALLMQVKVGKGSLILSGLNFDVALRNGGPEALYVLGRLIRYAQSLPAPAVEWPVEFLHERVASSPFAQGPLVAGFDGLVFYKGERARGQTYRDLDAEALRIRQEEPLHRVEWQTDVTPEAPCVTFVFAGGFPFMAPPDKLPGFTLTANGRRLLDFDTTKVQARWDGEDTGASLLYVPGHARPSWSDTAGLFYLSVPAEFLTPGGRCILEVRSRGSDNKRWFALHPYADVLSTTGRE